MSTAKARNAHARAILGEELFTQLSNTKVLLVGAGGIGCELRTSLFMAAALDPELTRITNIRHYLLSLTSSHALQRRLPRGPIWCLRSKEHRLGRIWPYHPS